MLENFVENTCGKLSVEISLREVWCEMFHPRMGAALTLGLGLGGSYNYDCIGNKALSLKYVRILKLQYSVWILSKVFILSQDLFHGPG